MANPVKPKEHRKVLPTSLGAKRPSRPVFSTESGMAVDLAFSEVSMAINGTRACGYYW